MSVAMVYPEPERGRGKKDPATKERELRGFSHDRLQAARTILRHSLETGQVGSGWCHPF